MLRAGERLFWVWDNFFAAVLGVVVVAMALDHDTPGPRRVVSTAALSAIVGLYLLLGRGRVGTRAVDRRSTAFLALVFGLYAVGVAGTAVVGLLLFALIPLTFLLLPLRPAIAVAVAGNLVHPVLVLLLDGATAHLRGHLVPASLMGVGLSVGLGVWIDNVVRQSHERADLIEELERSRAEVTRLSHEAGAAAERARLAGEIHDTLAQGFTSIIMLLQAADAELERDPDRARGRLAQSVRTARENLAESRALVAALAPPALGSTALPHLVGRHVERLGEEASIAAAFEVIGDARPLATSVEVVLLRSTQEALANVRRHAAASWVAVRLEYGDCTARLLVRDDGRGFSPGGQTDGYGLLGMRARAEQVGGKLIIHSRASGGTTIEVEVPT